MTGLRLQRRFFRVPGLLVLLAFLSLSLPARAAPPIYACYVIHLEEYAGVRSLSRYLADRESLRLLAEAIRTGGADLDFQPDWTILSEVGTYDHGPVTADTDGKNLLRYFRENLGFSIDPHAHETVYNIADVAFLIEELNVVPSGVAGGFLFAPQRLANWERFSAPVRGMRYPDYSWTCSSIWGGSYLFHRGNDDRASGVWRPRSGDFFYRHDSAGPLANIGGGKRDYGGLQELLQCQENGLLEKEKIYTAAIFISHGEAVSPGFRLEVENQIAELRPYVEAGRLIWATLPETLAAWEANGGQPSVYRFERNFPVSSGDYDGDGTAEIGIFRPGAALWDIRGLTRFYFGSSGDEPVSGDYDGDGTADPAVFGDTTGCWVVRGMTRFYFGAESDRPVPADYGGDGTCRPGVFREGVGLWAVKDWSRFYWGGYGDIPLAVVAPAGGPACPAVYRWSNGLWAFRGEGRMYFGGADDTPAPGDYNGDGIVDIAVFRPVSGLWACRGDTRVYFGGPADYPVPADYDGSGDEDIAVFRPSNGKWLVRGVTLVYHGAPGDLPAANP